MLQYGVTRPQQIELCSKKDNHAHQTIIICILFFLSFLFTMKWHKLLQLTLGDDKNISTGACESGIILGMGSANKR